MIKQLTKLSSIVAAFLGIAGLEHAQAAYPDRPIQFVVPFAPGGSTDLAARVIGERLSQKLGVSIVVRNEPGASGLRGAMTVSQAKPDGYTFLVTSNGIHSAAATPESSLNLTTDLAAVTEIAGGALILLSSKSAPFDSVKGYLDYAKQPNQKPLNVAINAVFGVAHIAYENFRRRAGIEYRPVYYNGESPSLISLVQGDCLIGIATAPAARAFIEGGRINALAVMTDKRFGPLPNVPTVDETVLPGFSEGYSNVMFAPPGTPAEIVQRIAGEVAAIVKEPDMAKKLEEQGTVAMGSTPEAYAAVVKREFTRNQQLIKELKASGQGEQKQ